MRIKAHWLAASILSVLALSAPAFAADKAQATLKDADGKEVGHATLFGTTGEGPSVSAKERDRVAAEMASAGIPAGRLVEAVLACSVEEAVFGTSRALRRGARAVLLAPPFYFRPVPDEGVFAWYAEVFRAVGPDLRDVILYHIPGMTGVPLSHALVARAADTIPGAVLRL